MTSTRRHFIAQGLFVVGAGTLLAGAGSALGSTIGVRFPQGVASGDPMPTSVVLWTRIEPENPTIDSVDGLVEVALDEGFTRVVARAPIRASRSSDYTVRVIVQDLEEDQRYFYRFRVGEAVSQPLGRTRTAPGHGSGRAVRFAAASCQNFEQGFYNSWSRLVQDDEAALPAEQLDFVLHLGDFIYEAVGHGEVRRVPALPSGGGPGPNPYAVTLEDYRHLYKVYLSDPDLIAARARFPFVCTWDDHEFSNDCWQSEATYVPGGQPAQSRRYAASQAWFEFIPAALSGAPDSNGVGNPASDFAPARISDAPFDTAPYGSDQPEPNNAAAIRSLRIYRAFRWGRMVDLIVTDTRSRRSAHAVPDALAIGVSGVARGFLPVSLVSYLDGGAADAPPPPIKLRSGEPAVLPEPPSRPGTMLGSEQKAWFLASLEASRAHWRIWANSLPLSPMRFDLDAVGAAAEPMVLTIDSWDGYPGERDAVFDHIADNAIGNVVSITGDHHMHFAGLGLRRNYAGEPACVEFAVAGISSQPFQTTLDKAVPADSPLRAIVAFDKPVATAASRADAFNMTMRHGVKSTLVAGAGGSETAGLAVRNPDQNPHLRFLDSRANGYAVFVATPDRLEVEYVTLATVARRSPEVERRVRLHTPSWTSGRALPAVEVGAVTGPPLFAAGN